MGNKKVVKGKHRMKRVNITHKLLMIKIMFYLLVITAATIISWTRHYVEAIALVILSFLFLLFFYKCPHCGYSLDFRFRIHKDTPCPMCKKIISTYDK